MLLHPYKLKLSKISEVPLSKSDCPVHSPAFRPLHELMVQACRIWILQYLDDWLIWAKDKETCPRDA